jgi:oligoribonuclease NrnB/cAMP/cGMP phosphodiesterase (DHH superfamily)
MTHKTKFNYIIFHKGCLDGFSGYFVSYISGRLTKDVEIYPDSPSTYKIPPNIGGKDILIVDVAYKKQVLEEIFKSAKSVVFIDHHPTIKNDVNVLYTKYNNNTNISIIYDDTRCGATLAWKYFNGRDKIPLFLKYVEDQDTGTWMYPQTKPFIYALKTYFHLSTEGKSINKWFRLLKKENVEKMIKRGKRMAKFMTHLVNYALPKFTLLQFPSQIIYNKQPELFEKVGQYKVAVYCGLNCPSTTELASAVFKYVDCDFCIMWVYNIDNKMYIMSMRSKKVNVGKICKLLFNGGGHKLAAGGSFKSSEYTIDDLFYGRGMARKIKK